MQEKLYKNNLGASQIQYFNDLLKEKPAEIIEFVKDLIFSHIIIILII
jgi:hypothetical protein